MFVNYVLHLKPSFGEALCYAAAQSCNTVLRRSYVRLDVAVATDTADTSVNPAVHLCAYTYSRNKYNVGANT